MATDSNDKDLPGADSSGPTPPDIPDYQLLRFIAGGSFGSVWLARHEGTFGAVKVVFRAKFKSNEDYEREFEGQRKFKPISWSHRNLIKLHRVGRSDEAGYFFYVMELGDDVVSGQQINPDTYKAKTLDNELSRCGGRLSFEECLNLGLAVADGLQHLNDYGLIHRDIKPSNIIFVNGIPKIADIGLVTSVDKSGSFGRGTPGFIDPYAPPWTVQADIYSLGKVLYEIGFGKDRQDCPAVPTEFDTFEDREQLLELNEVITKACDIRARRYRTAAEMHADLLLLRSGRSLRRVRTLERRLALAKRVVLVAGVILLLVGALFLKARGDAKRATQRQAASYVTVGAQAIAQGDLIGSLPWFTAALDLEKGDPERERTHRVRIGSVLRQCPRVIRMWFHDRPIRAVDVSPDGRHIVAGDESGKVLVWDITNGGEPATLAGHSEQVVSVAYSPDTDGRLIASASFDGTVRVWDASTHREIYRPLDHHKNLSSVHFSPDGTLILTTADDDKVKLFDTATGKSVAEPFEHPSLNYADFAPDGRSIATASWEVKPLRWYHNAVLVWRISTNATIGSGSFPIWVADTNHVIRHEALIYQVAVSPDGRRLATASADKTARIWDARTGFQLHKLKHPQLVRSVRFSPDGRYVLTACDDLTARLWNAETGEEASPPLKHSGYLYEAVFSPDGRYVVTATVQGVVSVWDLSPNNWLPTLTTAAYSADGNLLVTHRTNVVQVRDVATDERLGTFRVNFAITDIRLNHNGSHILVISAKQAGEGSTNRWAQLWHWDGAKASPLAAPFICDDSITSAALSRDGGKLLSFLGTVAQLRDAATWLTNAPTLLHSSKVKAVSWDPTGRFVLTRTEDKAYLWDAILGLSRPLQLDPLKGVRYAEFSPDGRKIVICYADDQINPLYAEILETSTGRRLGEPLPHGDGVLHASFSKNGGRIVTSSEFKTAQIWDTKTNGLLRVLRHNHEVWSSAFSVDDQWIVSACRDGTARVWEAESGEPITPPIKLVWGASPTRVQFIGGQRGLLMTRYLFPPPQFATADLAPDNSELPKLDRLAKVLSGHRSDLRSGALPLETRELTNAWMQLSADLKKASDNSLITSAQWHEGQAAASEATTNWFAVVFHLDRLAKLKPDDPSVRAKRDEAQKLREEEKIK